MYIYVLANTGDVFQETFRGDSRVEFQRVFEALPIPPEATLHVYCPTSVLREFTSV